MKLGSGEGSAAVMLCLSGIAEQNSGWCEFFAVSNTTIRIPLQDDDLLVSVPLLLAATMCVF